MRVLRVAATTAAALTVTAPAATAAPGRELDLRGRLVVVHADGKRLSGVRYYLAAGRAHYRLRFRRRPPLSPGSRVRIHGRRRAGAIEVAGVRVTASAHAAAGAEASGTRTLLAILVRWGSADPSTTQSGARTFLFG